MQAFVCGLAAGMLAKLGTHPLDVAKKRFQVGALLSLLFSFFAAMGLRLRFPPKAQQPSLPHPCVFAGHEHEETLLEASVTHYTLCLPQPQRPALSLPTECRWRALHARRGMAR